MQIPPRLRCSVVGADWKRLSSVCIRLTVDEPNKAWWCGTDRKQETRKAPHTNINRGHMVRMMNENQVPCTATTTLDNHSPHFCRRGRRRDQISSTAVSAHPPPTFWLFSDKAGFSSCKELQGQSVRDAASRWISWSNLAGRGQPGEWGRCYATRTRGTRFVYPGHSLPSYEWNN